MISYKRLPGSSLAGLDMFNFSSYWNTLKNKIADIQQLGFVISTYQQKLGVAKSILVARNDRNKYALDDEISKVQDDLDKWWKVKGYIDKYLPEWVKADPPGTTIVNSLSILPIVMGATAIAALAYCVNVGMALLQDYALKRSLTADVIAQKITSGQAADILSVPREKGVFEEAIKSVGAGLGFGIPTALLIGGGLYLAFVSGMFKGLLGGGSPQSSS